MNGYKSWNPKELLRKCLEFHWFHTPAGWVTNRADAAGDTFTQELHEKNSASYDFYPVSPTPKSVDYRFALT